MADLIKIIKEEFTNILNEMGNDDFIDPRTINLQEEYDKLNNSLFGGAIKGDVPLKWDNSRKHLGVVQSMRNRFSGEIKINHLAISNFYKLSYRQFKDTLAHEMIHVWQIFKFKSADHGWSFLGQAKRINDMNLGFNITTRNSEDIGVSDQQKAAMGNRTVIAIIFNIDGKYGYVCTTPATYEREKDALFNIIETFVNRERRFGEVELTVVESNSPELAGSRIARTFQRGFSYSPLSDRLMEEILNGNIIKNIKFKRGVPTVVSEEVMTEGNSEEWETIEIS